MTSNIELGDLSDPSKTNDIPWPSPLPLSSRFHYSPENGVRTFRYMGRSVFEAVWTKATSNWYSARERYQQLYLYGLAGVGKSHLMAALVFYLVRQGHRVVYIPDCRAALANPFHYIQGALLFAFYGDSDSYYLISEAENMDDLRAVVTGHYPPPFYLIVNQCNALEVDVGKIDLQESTKVAMYCDLEKIGAFQKYIFSASAGAESNCVAERQQTGIEVIRFNAGMTPVRPHFSECLILHSLGRDRHLVRMLRPLVPQGTP